MNIETANRLFQYRKQHHLSQEELADKIGVSRQAVSKWERAEASPDTDNLILLANIYGVTLDELLQGKEEPRAKQPEKDEPNICEREPELTGESAEQKEKTDKNPSGGESEYIKSDQVSFKNGIHVHSKDGDHVDISLKDGIKVEDKNGTKVNVGFSGVHVEENGEKKVYTDENGHVFYTEEVAQKQKHKKKNPWMMFPFPVLAVIVFFVWGFSGMWLGFAASWLVFLTVPLYYTAVEAIIKRDAKIFCFPVLVLLAFFIAGFFYGLWHPAWVLFISIPLYYFVCDLLHMDKDWD